MAGQSVQTGSGNRRPRPVRRDRIRSMPRSDQDVRHARSSATARQILPLPLREGAGGRGKTTRRLRETPPPNPPPAGGGGYFAPPAVMFPSGSPMSAVPVAGIPTSSIPGLSETRATAAVSTSASQTSSGSVARATRSRPASTPWSRQPANLDRDPRRIWDRPTNTDWTATRQAVSSDRESGQAGSSSTRNMARQASRTTMRALASNNTTRRAAHPCGSRNIAPAQNAGSKARVEAGITTARPPPATVAPSSTPP